MSASGGWSRSNDWARRPWPSRVRAKQRHPIRRPKTAGGSASPKGEARRERAGKAERSDRRAREDYGWGWAGRCNQAVPPNQVRTPLHHTRGSTSRTSPPAPKPTDPPNSTRGSASPKGEARRKRAGKAERSDRRAREDYGWGWAARCNQTVPPNQLKTPLPNTRGSTSRTPPPAPPPTDPPNSTRGSASPKGEARRQGRRQGRAKRMPRQGGLRVGVGGRCNQTVPPNQLKTPLHHTRGSTSRTSPPAPPPKSRKAAAQPLSALELSASTLGNRSSRARVPRGGVPRALRSSRSPRCRRMAT